MLFFSESTETTQSSIKMSIADENCVQSKLLDNIICSLVLAISKYHTCCFHHYSGNKLFLQKKERLVPLTSLGFLKVLYGFLRVSQGSLEFFEIT